jgi:hypothetical protein
MKYVLLLNNDTEQAHSWHSLSAKEVQKLREREIPRWNDFMGWMTEQGIEASGVELENPSKARVVRVRDGQTVVTDGPFAETKETLGGYFLVDCKDLDQAIEVAERVPLVDRGSVEIRPLVPH